MKRHKYGAKPTTVDGIRFASQAEARRYRELTLLLRAGKILWLQCQPSFDLVVDDAAKGRDVKVGRYVADFRYTMPNGVMVVEDVKGVRTPIYRLKKKMVEALYGITVVEISA